MFLDLPLISVEEGDTAGRATAVDFSTTVSFSMYPFCDWLANAAAVEKSNDFLAVYRWCLKTYRLCPRGQANQPF